MKIHLIVTLLLLQSCSFFSKKDPIDELIKKKKDRLQKAKKQRNLEDTVKVSHFEVFNELTTKEKKSLEEKSE